MTPTELPSTAPREMSPIEARLYHHLAEHASSEADFIASYRELEKAPDTPEAARYLIRLVVEDEERHHRLFHEMTSALGHSVYSTDDPEAVPDLSYGPPTEAFEAGTARFLAAEKADQKQLRSLRKELRALRGQMLPFRDTDLWVLLIELMEHDTAKHIHLLTFIRDHAAARPKNTGRPLPPPKSTAARKAAALLADADGGAAVYMSGVTRRVRLVGDRARLAPLRST